MKSNRVNLTLTFSAALAGLALTVLTPLAHGHGNNPKLTSDTDPNTGSTPPPPPESGYPKLYTNGGSSQWPAALESFVDPGIDITVDVANLNANDVLSQVLSTPATVDIAVIPDLLDPSPQIGVDLGGSTGAGGVITTPMSSVVPAPGTLALIGLAGAAARRRRRRRR